MKHAANLSLFTVAALPNSAAGGHLAPPERFRRKTIPWQADNAPKRKTSDLVEQIYKSKRTKPKPLAEQGSFIPLWTNRSGTVMRVPEMKDIAILGALDTLRDLGDNEVYNGLPTPQWRNILMVEQAKRIQK